MAYFKVKLSVLAKSASRTSVFIPICMQVVTHKCILLVITAFPPGIIALRSHYDVCSLHLIH